MLGNVRPDRPRWGGSADSCRRATAAALTQWSLWSMPVRVLERLARRATQLSRPAKSAIAFSADGLAIPLALEIASFLTGTTLLGGTTTPAQLYVAASFSSVLALRTVGAYRAVFRFVSVGGLIKGAIGLLCANALLAGLGVLLQAPVSSRCMAVLAALELLYLIGSRVLLRELLYVRRGHRERVAIYGAGDTGVQLARSLRDGGQYTPAAFIDADPALHHRVIAGVKVYGPDELPSLVNRHMLSSVLLALPSCTRRQRQMILKSLEPLPVHVRTVPDISDIVAGHASVSDVREVDPSDLLGRD
ncbi:MAG TPA: hypothetical protein VF193_12560, partial [Steroidobacter sp.]